MSIKRASDFRLSVDDLQNMAEFTQVSELSLKELPAFVKEYYWLQRSRVTYFHYLVSLLTSAAFFALLFALELSWEDGLMAFGLSALVFLALLPLHEGIHGLAYRAVGATDIRYGFKLREGFAYAVAHNFVADRRQFTLVAIAPFVIISLGLIVLAFLVPGWALVITSALALHTGGTSGDFSLLNFLWLHWDEEPYTYDDADNQVSYFYIAQQSPQLSVAPPATV